MNTTHEDPRAATRVKEPPTSWFGVLTHLGPSVILSASIVGSGELIMTTTLGAEVGFVALWVILVSCVVKVCIQLEFGKYAISSGRTTMWAFDRLAGPSLGGVRWTIWIWLIAQALIFVQYGGIVTGVGQALHIALPQLGVGAWSAIAGVSTAVLLTVGQYRLIQNVSLVLMVIFTLFTLVCVGLLQSTPYAISGDELLSGLQLRMPAAALGAAVAAFGLTGVGASEITAYPYWCLERGYATYTGSDRGDSQWTDRARGWTRVMIWDSVLSMVVYTVVTAAFYVLGAAVLHRTGQVPERDEMIQVLSGIYTAAAGRWAMVLFLAGAIVVLYSTLFAGSAAWTRMFSDAFAQAGFLNYDDPKQRRRWVIGLAWFFPLAWTFLGLTFQTPVAMVKAGGVANALLLLLVVYAAVAFRYRWLPAALRPSRFYDLCLWLSFAAIIAVATPVVIQLLRQVG